MSSSQRSTTLDRPDPDSSWASTIERLQSFIAARVGDRELAADLTQDVIVRSIASGALDRVDNPSAWLYRSARNAVIDHYRTKRVHDPLPEPDQWPDPDLPGNEPNEATRELAHCLQPLLAELPDTARDALTRVDLHGATHHAAADELGISVSGMKSRVQRARRQLRDLLTGCCEVDLDRAGAVADYHPVGGECGDCS
jgi:RNA polymerase sigma-70 factor (ECF subfamily)